MLKGQPQTLIQTTVDYLSDYNSHLQHNTRLSIDDLTKNTALKIIPLESNQKLQELVLSLYHCYQIAAGLTKCSKIIENQKSIKFVKNHIV